MTISPHAYVDPPYRSPSEEAALKRMGPGRAINDAADKIAHHLFELRQEIDKTAPTYTPRVKDTADAITEMARRRTPVDRGDAQVLRDVIAALRAELERGRLPVDDVSPTGTALLRDELRLTFDAIGDPNGHATVTDAAGRASGTTAWRAAVGSIVAEHGASSDRAKVLASTWFAAYARSRGADLDTAARQVVAEHAESSGSGAQKHAAAALRAIDTHCLAGLAAHAVTVAEMRAGAEPHIDSSHT